MKVVVISSSSQVRQLAAMSLHLHWPNITLLGASTARAGLELVEQESPELVFLRPDFTDLPLSEVLPGLRRLSTTPVVVLSYRGDEMETVAALELGADDYVPLPCDPTELMARTWALLRRVGRTYREGLRPGAIGGLLANRPVSAFRPGTPAQTADARDLRAF